MELTAQVRAIVEEVRRELAPDPRLAVYEVAVVENEDGLTLVGATSEPAAAEALHRRVGVLEGGIPVRDELERLPGPALEGGEFALVRASAAPILAGPMVSDPIVSQTVFGHRLAVLRQRGRWLQCRSADGYIGWVHRGYVHRVSQVEASEWEMGTGGEQCFSLGAVLMGDREVLAQLPWGSRVVRDPDGSGRTPDGSRGVIDGEIVAATALPQRFPAMGERVVETAMRWIGAPYFWGGITPAGVDCSGLVQASFRTHGVELPRDSDQQARVGEEFDPGPDFGAARPGDLLFFAEDRDRITHVTLSAGGSRIVHSSLGNGGVRCNDLLGEMGFEQELRRLFVTARRVLPAD